MDKTISIERVKPAYILHEDKIVISTHKKHQRQQQVEPNFHEQLNLKELHKKVTTSYFILPFFVYSVMLHFIFIQFTRIQHNRVFCILFAPSLPPSPLRQWDLRKSEEIWGKYEGIWRIMWKIWRSTTTTWSLGLRRILSSPPLYRLWDLEIFRAFSRYKLWDFEKFRAFPAYIGFGTWKYSELSRYLDSGPLHNLWDLEKFRTFPLTGYAT